ncbi:hypothetical protein [Nonomuraea bangladeshensis]|uniref:hypothetical protein n=1 Tax=Nonomuraea bangladeshensis TaxID=404385 RepID=UPI003C2E16DA
MNYGIDQNSSRRDLPHGPMSNTDPNSRGAKGEDWSDVIGAWTRLDVRDRQLAVLRNTFPYWAVGYELDSAGHCTWKAATTWPLTLEMVTAGVLRELQRSDPITLMADLTSQTEMMGEPST